MTMRLAHLGFAVIGITTVIVLAHAQAPGDPQRGSALAQRFCAECHATGKRDASSPSSEAPSFTAVASTPGMTAMALNVFFQTPHKAMPNLILETDQKNDIVAYIMSLKK
jgi:mono/diheme cytochrome c family protein